MKIIAIGDIHGRTIWEGILEKEHQADMVVFIGDYFDSLDKISTDDQIKNFERIISLKRRSPNNVILLFGNHDFHYLNGCPEHYSGYQQFRSRDISDVVELAIKERLVQMAFRSNNYLFTHAGVTNTWLQNCGYYSVNQGSDSIDDFINQLFYSKPMAFRFTVGENWDEYGNDITQTPIWVRPEALISNMPDGYVQIVGHTQQKDGISITDDLILIDTLGATGEYLKIEDNIVTIAKI